MAMTPEQAMQMYYADKRAVELAEGECAAKCAKPKERMKLLLQWMETYTHQMGLKNLPVDGLGTGYFTTHLSAVVANPAEFRGFVEANNAWDLVELRAASKSIKSYIDGNNAPVPGVSFSAVQVFKVRAANSTSEKE
jgi:hypothetical protein